MTNYSSNIDETRTEEDIALAQEQDWMVRQILAAYQLPPVAIDLTEAGSAGVAAWYLPTRTREDLHDRL